MFFAAIQRGDLIHLFRLLFRIEQVEMLPDMAITEYTQVSSSSAQVTSPMAGKV